MGNLNAVVAENQIYILIAIGVIFLILFGVIINLHSELSNLKRRHKKMMAGVSGGNLEKMLNSHIDEVAKVKEVQKALEIDITKIQDVLSRAIIHKAIIRFNAFEDTGSDLSYCVALLDENQNGVVLSAIYAGDVTRNYAKPIEKGISPHYKLTPEEEEVLKKALIK